MNGFRVPGVGHCRDSMLTLSTMPFLFVVHANIACLKIMFKFMGYNQPNLGVLLVPGGVQRENELEGLFSDIIEKFPNLEKGKEI